MLARQQPLPARLGEDGGQELGRYLALQQPIAVLGEGRMIPHRVVDPDPDEPAKQEVELQPLHEPTLRAHRIECLQQHRPQQHLGRDRRTPYAGIERCKIDRQRFKRSVGQRADRPQRMIPPHALLKIDVREKFP
jgi:hypothetical protein